MLIHQTSYRQFWNSKYCVARPRTTSRKTKRHTNYGAVPGMANPWVDYAFTLFLHDHNVGGLLNGCCSPRENTHPPTPTETTVDRVQRITVQFALRPIGRWTNGRNGWYWRTARMNGKRMIRLKILTKSLVFPFAELSSIPNDPLGRNSIFRIYLPCPNPGGYRNIFKFIYTFWSDSSF